MNTNEPQFHTLPNGLQIAMWPQPHLHAIGVGLYVRVGPRYEQVHNMGISHFVEHVLFRGNSRYPTSLEMNRAFEAWGGSINAYTTREYTYFYGKSHPDYLDESIQFMSDLVREPQFAALEIERKIILEERLQDVDADGQLLEEDDISRQHFWEDHPLGYPIIGTAKSLRQIKESDLREHFARFYGTRHFVLCLTGSFSPEQAIETCAKAFANMPEGSATPVEEAPLPAGPSKQTAFIHHDSSQIALLLSFRGPDPSDPDFFPLLLVDRILDDGMSSRLWQRLVETKGLCYDLWASIDPYSDTSIFEVGASIAPEKVIALVEGIYRELAILREEGPSQEEFELARRRWRLGQEFLLDKVNGLNERLGPQVLYDRYLPREAILDRIEKLTREELMASMQKLFQSNNHLLTAVGPISKSLKRKLRELAKNFGTP